MSIHKSYVVFGLGRYGRAVAKGLIDSGADVMAIDSSEDVVNSAIADIPFCKCADITNYETIKSLGISNVDVVIITMASNLEASIMATMLCKECGVKTVIVKCSSEMNQKILQKIGADIVIFPEQESGLRLAKNLVTSGFVDLVELSKDISMVELDVKDEWIGKNLIELNLRRKYSINIAAIIKNNDIIVNIDPVNPLEKDMKLIVVAHKSKLQKLK